MSCPFRALVRARKGKVEWKKTQRAQVGSLPRVAFDPGPRGATGSWINDRSLDMQNQAQPAACKSCRIVPPGARHFGKAWPHLNRTPQCGQVPRGA